MMFDVHSTVRFEVAQIVCKLYDRDLIQVLSSSSFSQLELGIVDVLEILYEVEQEYNIYFSDKYLFSSLEDIVSVICGENVLNSFGMMAVC
ncbi:hypothetical protein [Pontibacter harenae]|uniref:hypothetical protein n=1 Tax=Pontibacter harenae TaxID=2894083 RepID=UPI001E4F499C|nr:hypothetical protein [Pontibacter harenae]MCC9169091.1 hypothetical protein [Pontibacter harenae]